MEGLSRLDPFCNVPLGPSVLCNDVPHLLECCLCVWVRVVLLQQVRLEVRQQLSRYEQLYDSCSDLPQYRLWSSLRSVLARGRQSSPISYCPLSLCDGDCLRRGSGLVHFIGLV